MHGFYPFPPSHARMPNLRRLHLSGNRNPHGIFQTGGLETASPKIAHLHISGLVSAASFAEELEHALTPENEAYGSTLFPATLPPSLKRVTVGTGPSPAATRRLASARAQHEKMTERLARLARCSHLVNDVRLELTEDGEDDVSCYDRLKRDWTRSFVARWPF